MDPGGRHGLEQGVAAWSTPAVVLCERRYKRVGRVLIRFSFVLDGGQLRGPDASARDLETPEASARDLEFDGRETKNFARWQSPMALI